MLKHDTASLQPAITDCPLHTVPIRRHQLEPLRVDGIGEYYSAIKAMQLVTALCAGLQMALLLTHTGAPLYPHATAQRILEA